MGLVVPWAQYGDILQYFDLRGWTGSRALQFTAEILSALCYLHSEDIAIVHRNLHPGNILVDENVHVRLVDFGLSVFTGTDDSSPNDRAEGAVRYMPPEILRPSRFTGEGEKNTTASDIYSFGMVCWRIYTGLAPFHDIYENQIAFDIVDGKCPLRSSSPRSIPDFLWEVMEACWQYQPTARPSASSLCSRLQSHFPTLARCVGSDA